MRATLSVCITCRLAGDAGDSAVDPRPGARLHAALAARGMPPGVTLRAVECLSACRRGCSMALQAPGKWSYVYGLMDPDAEADHVGQILAGAAAYAASDDGLVPWRERPLVFRKQALARIPPMPTGPAEPAGAPTPRKTDRAVAPDQGKE